MKTPAVSIIIPAFNAARTVERAVESIFNQTFDDYEVLVVDDGSTDDTVASLSRFGSRLKVIQKANAGVSVARNVGVASSKAPLLAFLDADDEWMPGKLALQMGRLSGRSEFVASFMSLILHDDATGIRRPLIYRHRPNLIEDLLLHSCIVGAPSSVIIRRDAFNRLGGFDPNLSQCADWDMWLRLVESGAVDVVEEPHVIYHLHSSNMSRNVRLLEADTRAVLDKWFSANRPEWESLRRRAFSAQYAILSGSYLHSGQYVSSVRCAVRSIAWHHGTVLRILATPNRILFRWLNTVFGDGERGL